MSHGDFFWRKKLSQKIIANPQSETYSASISINRPFSMMPMFVIQISAASIDPLGVRLARATVTKATATASTKMADGRRAVHSLRTPERFKGCGYQPVYQGRFPVVRITAHLRDNVVARLKHPNSRQDSAPFFPLNRNRAERRQENHRPCEHSDSDGSTS